MKYIATDAPITFEEIVMVMINKILYNVYNPYNNLCIAIYIFVILRLLSKGSPFKILFLGSLS